MDLLHRFSAEAIRLFFEQHLGHGESASMGKRNCDASCAYLRCNGERASVEPDFRLAADRVDNFNVFPSNARLYAGAKGLCCSLLGGESRGKGTVGKLLHDPSLYNRSDETMTETRNLLRAIRQNPKRYLSIRLRIF